MKTAISLASSAFVGVIFGVLSNYSVLRDSWFNLPVWAAVGLLIGTFIYDKKFIRWSGVFYGFFLVLFFLISGFQDSGDKITMFGAFSIVLSMIGALLGWCLVFMGNWIREKFAE